MLDFACGSGSLLLNIRKRLKDAGATLINDWDLLRETNPARVPKFDAVVANPPFSYRWEPTDSLAHYPAPRGAVPGRGRGAHPH